MPRAYDSGGIRALNLEAEMLKAKAVRPQRADQPLSRGR